MESTVANNAESPLALAELFRAIARFKAQYGTYPPEPLRVSDAFRERIEAASIFSIPRQGQPFALASDDLPEKVLGFRFIVDDRVPKDEMRIYYEDANGQMQLLTLKGLM